MAFITIAVQCHNFQKRLCWMLSSLAEQTEPQSFIVNIAHMALNGTPSTEAVIGLFQKHIIIKSVLCTDYNTFQRRGLVRNQQLLECQTDWILFSDCDMVYHPEYFQHLMSELNRNHPNANYLLSAGRQSTEKGMTNKLVDSSIGEDPALISKTFVQLVQLPLIRRGNVGAGFSQIINTKYAPHEGYYVAPHKTRDWPWDRRYQKARSDIQFRRRIAHRGHPRVALPSWFSENLVHLNHNRDKDVGHHLEEQR